MGEEEEEVESKGQNGQVIDVAELLIKFYVKIKVENKKKTPNLAFDEFCTKP